jgi:hypothetical protein
MTLTETPVAGDCTIEMTGTRKQVRLINDDYSNDVFEENLAYFEEHQPELYKHIRNHQCTDYRLCFNPDGSPNIIYIPDNRVLYYTDGNLILNSTIHGLESIPFNMDISPAYALAYDAEWHDKNVITTRLYRELLDTGPLKMLVEDEGRRRFNESYNPDFIPFIRIYGIGLGYHITRLLQSRNVLATLIYEPEIDLFYVSLFTIRWRQVFEYMNCDGNRRFSLIVASSPREAVQIEKQFLATHFPFLPIARWQIKLFDTEPVREFIRLENDACRLLSDTLTAGWYEDQKAGLANCLGNLARNTPVFTGKKTARFLRIAIVGAGPSLDDSIGYLRAHADDFIIFACGTAITPLLKNNIMPDYHIHQERCTGADAMLKWADAEDYRDIISLKLNVIDPEVDAFYRDTFIFQKFNDPASSLLTGNFTVSKNTNPTVTNSAIAFAGDLGADEVYLFGVDYGAAPGREQMHAQHYIHAHRDNETVDRTSLFTLPGNLGQTVISTDKLMTSHKVAEFAIAACPGIAWFNVGDGALVRNTGSLQVRDLPVTFGKHVDKSAIRDEIAGCFSNDYTADAIIDSLQQHHIPAINDYMAVVRELAAQAPASRADIVNTLAVLYQAAEIGSDHDHFMPHKLFSGSIKRFIDDVYIQTCMFDNENDAAEFYRSAVRVLDRYLDAMQQDVLELLNQSVKAATSSTDDT